MKERKYFPEVDFLKAFAALLVILIHVLANYKDQSGFMFFLWDYIHIAVGLFVFASGFLAAQFSIEISSLKEAKQFFLKKFKRIVIPYYKFALLFVLIYLLFGKLELSQLLNFDYWLDTILLNGGVGNNWIPRLFISIFLVVMVEAMINLRLKWVRALLVALSLGGSIYLLTRDLNLPWNFHYLPGWLLIFYTGWSIAQNGSRKKVVALFLVSLIVWLILWKLLRMMGMDIGIFANKYPPNLYFVAYNLAGVFLIWKLSGWLYTIVINNEKVWSIIRYLSRTSYEIFFYHLILLGVWNVKIHPIVDWILAVVITVGGIYLVQKLWGKFPSIQLRQSA